MDVGVLARRRRGAGERLRRGAHQLRRVRLEREVHVVSRDLHPNPRGVVGFLLPPRGLHDGHERRVPRDGSMHPSSRPNRSRRRPRTITTRGGACPLGRGRERGVAGRVRAARSRGRAVDTAPTDAPRVVASAPPRREPLGEEETHLSERQLRLESRGRRRFGLGPIFISALARKKLTSSPVVFFRFVSRAVASGRDAPPPPRARALAASRGALERPCVAPEPRAEHGVFQRGWFERPELPRVRHRGRDRVQHEDARRGRGHGVGRPRRRVHGVRAVRAVRRPLRPLPRRGAVQQRPRRRAGAVPSPIPRPRAEVRLRGEHAHALGRVRGRGPAMEHARRPDMHRVRRRAPSSSRPSFRARRSPPRRPPRRRARRRSERPSSHPSPRSRRPTRSPSRTSPRGKPSARRSTTREKARTPRSPTSARAPRTRGGSATSAERSRAFAPSRARPTSRRRKRKTPRGRGTPPAERRSGRKESERPPPPPPPPP